MNGQYNLSSAAGENRVYRDKGKKTSVPGQTVLPFAANSNNLKKIIMRCFVYIFSGLVDLTGKGNHSVIHGGICHSPGFSGQSGPMIVKCKFK